MMQLAIYLLQGEVTEVALPLADGGILILSPTDNPYVWESGRLWLEEKIAPDTAIVTIYGERHPVVFRPPFTRIKIPRGSTVRLDLFRGEFA